MDKSNAKDFEVIVDNVPFGVSPLDSKMRIIRLNGFVEERTDKKSEKVRGKYCFEIAGQYAVEGRVCDGCGVVRAIEDGKIYVFEREVRPGLVVKNVLIPVKEDGR